MQVEKKSAAWRARATAPLGSYLPSPSCGGMGAGVCALVVVAAAAGGGGGTAAPGTCNLEPPPLESMDPSARHPATRSAAWGRDRVMRSRLAKEGRQGVAAAAEGAAAAAAAAAVWVEVALRMLARRAAPARPGVAQSWERRMSAHCTDAWHATSPLSLPPPAPSPPAPGHRMSLHTAAMRAQVSASAPPSGCTDSSLHSAKRALGV